MNRRILKDESGMIMVLVVTFVVIMTIVVMGALSRNTSQTLMNIKDQRRLQAEQIAQGAYWLAYSNYSAGGVPTNYTQTINNVNYVIGFTRVAAPPLGNRIVVNVTYD